MPSPDAFLSVVVDGRSIFTVRGDGGIEYDPEYGPMDAAKACWEYYTANNALTVWLGEEVIAQVRMDGTLTFSPTYSPTQESMTFWVALAKLAPFSGGRSIA